MLVSRFGFRGKSTTLCWRDGKRWNLEVGTGYRSNPEQNFPGFDRSLDVGKNPSRFFAVPIFFRSVFFARSCPKTCQRFADSLEHWDSWEIPTFVSLSSNNCLHLFVFYIFPPPKKTNDPLEGWTFSRFFFFPREPPVTVTQPIHPSTWEAEPPHQGRYFRQAGFFRRDPYRKSDGYFRQWILSPNCLFASKIIMVFRCVFLELLFFVGWCRFFVGEDFLCWVENWGLFVA